MGVPIEVPGLSTIIPELEEGRLVVAESGADAAKSFFVRRLSLSARRAGWPVSFVTTRDREEVERQLEREGGPNGWSEDGIDVIEHDGGSVLERVGERGGLLAIDSFSFLALDLSGSEVARMLRDLRSLCREHDTTIILGTDRGMLDPKSDAVVAHLADGMIEFHSKEGPEGLIRFLRIPKWTDGKIVDRNVHYDFDGVRIAVDLRSRVL